MSVLDRFTEALLEMAEVVRTEEPEREDAYGPDFPAGAAVVLVMLAESERLYELDDDLRPHPLRPHEWIEDPDDPERDPGFERLMEIVADQWEAARRISLDAFLRRLRRDDDDER